MDFAGRARLDPAARLLLLEDEAELRWMKAYYAQVCDDKFTDGHVAKPQAEIDAAVRPMVERVFAEDASWGGFTDGAPPVVGRAAIFERLRTSLWTFAMHYYGNPVITLDGDRARARWMLWEPCTSAETGRAMWMGAITHDEYVRTAVGWRIKTYAVTYKFLTPFDRPWTEGNAP